MVIPSVLYIYIQSVSVNAVYVKVLQFWCLFIGHNVFGYFFTFLGFVDENNKWYQTHDSLITFNNNGIWLGPLKTKSGGGFWGGSWSGTLSRGIRTHTILQHKWSECHVPDMTWFRHAISKTLTWYLCPGTLQPITQRAQFGWCAAVGVFVGAVAGAVPQLLLLRQDVQCGQRELEVWPHVLVDVDVRARGHGHSRYQRLALNNNTDIDACCKRFLRRITITWSMWKVATPVGRSMIAFSETCIN